MTCLCAQSLSSLLALLQGLEPPSISLPASLQLLASLPLSAMASGSLSASASAAAALGVSASAMAQISAVASATAAVKAGLGIDLTAPGASLALSATIGAVNANLSAFLALGALDPAPWMSLSMLASLAMNVKLALGIDMFAAGAAGLQAALDAAFSGSASASAAASASASASLSATASAMGVADLSASGAMDMLAANLSLVASLSIPAIDVPLGVMVNPLALLAALANIIAGLGLNPFAPGFASACASLNASLSAYADLSLSAALSMSAVASAMASADASASLSASASVSALASFSAPNLGPLTAIASLSLSCSAAGFPIAMPGGCPICPMLA
jgi:hypothetical protein